MQGKNSIKAHPTIGCCGLDCGLCPTYNTKGPSRCPGCYGSDFLNKHPSCSIGTCCVKKSNFETCAECSEFPCSKLKDWDKRDSFICHIVSLSNLKYIQENGLDPFLTHQKIRIELLEEMLNNFNEGRSKSFFCIATAVLPIKDLEQALEKTEEKIKEVGISLKDLKVKSKILKEKINKIANRKKIELKLRRN